jgi:hypothetical protein
MHFPIFKHSSFEPAPNKIQYLWVSDSMFHKP